MLIEKDDVFIYPTDTVWGIGCSLYSLKGYLRIAEIKKTITNKPLSIMFASVIDLYNYFDFPEKMTLDWLEEFFKLETTMGFPSIASKKQIPNWATGESNYLCVRTLESNTIKNIFQNIKTPFFTTSLNLAGEAPIVSTDKALLFKNNYAPDAYFIGADEKTDLSGSSSTIVFFQEDLGFEIKREGRKIEAVRKHLMKLFIK